MRSHETVGNRWFYKYHQTIYRSGNPNCKFRTHYEIVEHNGRFSLKVCRCLSQKNYERASKDYKQYVFNRRMDAFQYRKDLIFSY